MEKFSPYFDVFFDLRLNKCKIAVNEMAESLKRSCNFSSEKSNELTDQQDMFYNMIMSRVNALTLLHLCCMN